MPRIHTNWASIIIVLAATWLTSASPFAGEQRAAAEPPILVDADFPGGNIVVDSIAGDTVTLHQDLRDTDGQLVLLALPRARRRGADAALLLLGVQSHRRRGVRRSASTAARPGRGWARMR